MKNLLFIFLFSALAVNAQKVALHTSAGVQHFIGVNGFINAYSAATAGDTIYLPGGGFSSPTVFDKQLYIFGAGHYPDSTQATAKTFVNGNFVLSENADGIYLEGFNVTGSLLYDFNEAVNNVIIKYLKIDGDINVQGNLTIPSINTVIINSIINGNVILSNGQNFGIFNSIIGGRILYSNGNLFENNILLYSYSGTASIYNLDGNNNVLNNNIILNANNRFITGTSNQMYNNLHVSPAPLYGTTPIFSGNYFGIAQNLIFINQTGYAFDYAHDYHLQSPTTYLGVDNTEVGLYGGTHGYKEGAVPSNPHIQLNNISPTTNNSGFLNVHIKGAAQDK